MKDNKTVASLNFSGLILSDKAMPVLHTITPLCVPIKPGFDFEKDIPLCYSGRIYSLWKRLDLFFLIENNKNENVRSAAINVRNIYSQYWFQFFAKNNIGRLPMNSQSGFVYFNKNNTREFKNNIWKFARKAAERITEKSAFGRGMNSVLEMYIAKNYDFISQKMLNNVIRKITGDIRSGMVLEKSADILQNIMECCEVKFSRNTRLITALRNVIKTKMSGKELSILENQIEHRSQSSVENSKVKETKVYNRLNINPDSNRSSDIFLYPLSQNAFAESKYRLNEQHISPLKSKDLFLYLLSKSKSSEQYGTSPSAQSRQRPNGQRVVNGYTSAENYAGLNAELPSKAASNNSNDMGNAAALTSNREYLINIQRVLYNLRMVKDILHRSEYEARNIALPSHAAMENHRLNMLPGSINSSFNNIKNEPETLWLFNNFNKPKGLDLLRNSGIHNASVFSAEQNNVNQVEKMLEDFIYLVKVTSEIPSVFSITPASLFSKNVAENYSQNFANRSLFYGVSEFSQSDNKDLIKNTAYSLLGKTKSLYSSSFDNYSEHIGLILSYIHQAEQKRHDTEKDAFLHIKGTVLPVEHTLNHSDFDSQRVFRLKTVEFKDNGKMAVDLLSADYDKSTVERLLSAFGKKVNVDIIRILMLMLKKSDIEKHTLSILSGSRYMQTKINSVKNVRDISSINLEKSIYSNGKTIPASEVPADITMLIPPTQADKFSVESGYMKQMPPIDFKQQVQQRSLQSEQHPKILNEQIREQSTVKAEAANGFENFSYAEISRLADKVYSQIEQRLIRERTRMGL